MISNIKLSAIEKIKETTNMKRKKHLRSSSSSSWHHPSNINSKFIVTSNSKNDINNSLSWAIERIRDQRVLSWELASGSNWVDLSFFVFQNIFSLSKFSNSVIRYTLQEEFQRFVVSSRFHETTKEIMIDIDQFSYFIPQMMRRRSKGLA